MDSPAAQRPEQLAYSPRARPAPRYQQRGDGRRVGREHDADEDQRWSRRRVLGELRKVEAIQVEGQKAKEEQDEHKHRPSMTAGSTRGRAADVASMSRRLNSNRVRSLRAVRSLVPMS